MPGVNYFLSRIIEAMLISVVAPRFGGMAIFIGSMAALTIPAGMNGLIKVAMLGGLLMYGLGVLDDIKDLKPAVKFGGQLLIASIVYALGVRITFISNFLELPGADSHANLLLGTGVGYVITVIWIVGITNAVNLMDGLDGLAAGSTAIMALSLAYVAYIHGMRIGSMPVCIALVAVAGGCIGFLPYNFSPAKTFMGDGGALYLGYMIAVLSVISPLKQATFAVSHFTAQAGYIRRSHHTDAHARSAYLRYAFRNAEAYAEA